MTDTCRGNVASSKNAMGCASRRSTGKSGPCRHLHDIPPAPCLRSQRRWLYNVCKLSLNIALLVVLMLILLSPLLALDGVLRG